MIAVAYYHRQPPFETPAAQTTRAKVFDRDETLNVVWLWATRNERALGQLVRLELLREEGE